MRCGWVSEGRRLEGARVAQRRARMHDSEYRRRTNNAYVLHFARHARALRPVVRYTTHPTCDVRPSYASSDRTATYVDVKHRDVTEANGKRGIGSC